MVPGSGTNPFRIPDPGVKKEPYPGSGSALNQSGSGSGGRVGGVKVKRIIFYLAKNLPTPLYTILFLFSLPDHPPPLLIRFQPVLRIRDVYPVSNKILNYLSSEVIKKILVNFQRIIELFV